MAQQRRRRSKGRRSQVRVSEAQMYSMVRGFLNLEVAGRTAGEVARLKLLGDVDVFHQPGASFERLGQNFRRMLGHLLGQSVVSQAQLEALLDAEMCIAATTPGSGESMLLDVEEFDAEGFFHDLLPDSRDENQIEANQAASPTADDGVLSGVGDLAAKLAKDLLD